MKNLLIIFILITNITILIADSGKLEEFENELKKPIEHDHHEEENNNEYSNLDENDEDNVLSNIFFYLIYEVFIGSEPPIDYYKFPPQIYNDDHSGRYSMNGTKFDADFELKYIYTSKQLDGISVSGNLFFLSAFSLKLLFQNFEEINNNISDKMTYYELFFDYYRCRLPGINWYWGAGAKGLERSDQYFGPALNTGIEIYPFKPISFEFAANIGWLNAHPVSKFNTGIKIHLWKIIVSSEYQRLQTGKSKINSLNIGLGFNF